MLNVIFQKKIKNIYTISATPQLGNGINNSEDNNIKLPVNTEKRPFLTYDRDLANPNKKINVAILGTKESEPIYDLLIKNKSGDLNCDIPIIISNHNDLKIISEQFNISYFKINDKVELGIILVEGFVKFLI